MALLPSVNYGNPVVEDMQFKTLMSNFDNLGVERRKRKWLYPKRTVTLQYNNITLSDARSIFQFYIDRSGAYEAFTFFKYETESFEGEYVGTGDGSTVTYDLPCKNSSARILYLNNVVQNNPADYTYSALGGLDGADQITFIAAPTSGHRIILDFTGNLKIRCRFKEDNMSFNTMYNRFRIFGVQLQGLLNS